MANNKLGFHIVKPMNQERTQFGLYFNHVEYVNGSEYNVTVDSELIDKEIYHDDFADVLSNKDIDNVANVLLARNNLKECAVSYKFE